MEIILVFVLVLCVLFVWFTAEYLVGFYLYPASLDVYGLLSFEFQTIDTTKKKIKQSKAVHMNRLLNSFPLRVTKLKRGWNDNECFDVMVYSIIVFLSKTKKAEVMMFPFVDDEESLQHPLMRELSEDDLNRYREKEKKLGVVAGELSSIGDGLPSEFLELSKELDALKKRLQEALHVEVLCVKKLPFTGRRKKQKIRLVTSPSEIMTKIREN